MLKAAFVALALAVAALMYGAHADEMSGDDKLRMLYSHRFSFGKDGLPLVTIELMHGQSSVKLSADKGLRVLPDGEGGAEISAGREWTVTVEDAHPAKIKWWTIVSRQAIDADVELWKKRGYTVKTFETGVVFGIEGDVIDSRELYLGIAPEGDEAAAARAAAAVTTKWKVDAFVHPEMVERPRGTVVARASTGTSGGTTVRNAGVMWFLPDGGADAEVTVADVVHGGGGAVVGAEKKETRAYRGQIYVTLDHGGALTVVNAISEDRLLAGLVPSEIFPDAPAEALQAQAVAARSEVLARIGTRHFADPFLLCSTQHCQVYGGSAPEDPRTSKAVTATRGEVLLRDGGGGLVPIYYSASCGGFGEHNENVWGTPADPSLRGRLDALGAGAKKMKAFAAGIDDQNLRAFLDSKPADTFCGATKYAKNRYRWTVKLTAAELDKLVAAENPSVGSVQKLTAQARGVSGRVKSLEITGAKGTVTIDGELKIRRLLGGLKSSLFLLRRDGETWIFDGAGFGHGVGMCQTGAIGMAEAGHDYKKILEHYYPGTHIRQLY